MRQTFGENYDYAAAEGIRRQTLAGDFSWMPEIRLVDAETLQDESGTQTSGTALGAYSAGNDTIYLSRELLENDPDRALEILTEEVGHALDARLNETDSAGDEGEIFSRLFAGETLSEAELDALQAENDSGVITVDGQEIEVEYGLFGAVGNFFSSVGSAISGAMRAIGDAVGRAFDAVASAVMAPFEMAFEALSDMWESIKDAVVKVLNSAWFNWVLTALQFVPIPIVQLAVRAVQAVKAAYMFYQGVKHGSFSMMLSGVAGMAGGAANVGGMLGASQRFIDTAGRVADWANRAARVHQAMSERDFGAALGLMSEAVGIDTRAGRVIDNVRRVNAVREAAASGDLIGAVELGADLLGDIPGDHGDEFLAAVSEHADTFGAVMNAVESGDYSAAAALLTEGFGDELGLSPELRGRIEDIGGALEAADGARRAISDGNYAGAAAMLFEAADTFDVGDQAREHLANAAETVARIDAVATLAREGDYGEAIALGASILDDDPSPAMRERVETLVAGAERVERVIEHIERDDYSGAIALAADGVGMPLEPDTIALLDRLEKRAERLVALHEAVGEGEVAESMAILEEIAGIELPTRVAARLEGVADVLEQLGSVADAIEDGHYTEAAELMATLADSVEEEGLASTMGDLSTLLQRLGFPSPPQREPEPATTAFA